MDLIIKAECGVKTLVATPHDSTMIHYEQNTVLLTIDEITLFNLTLHTMNSPLVLASWFVMETLQQEEEV
jgi:hypothetical protein